jgi:hypothetical protein
MGADKVSIFGQLTINQRDPYEMGSVKRVINYDSEDLDVYLRTNTLNDFIDYINTKNNTCKITNDYQYFSLPSGNSNRIEIVMEIKIPLQQEFVYVPTVLESLKIAWIQYLAILIPSLYAIYYLILGFAFRNKVIDTQIKNDIRDEVMTYEKGFMYSRKF